MQPFPAWISASVAATAAAFALTAAPAAAQDVAGFKTPGVSVARGANKGRLPGLYPAKRYEPRRGHGRHDRRDRDDDFFWLGDAALGYAEPDLRPRSFFDGHGRVDIIGGEAVYSYDRSYPYRHSGQSAGYGLGYAERATRCSTTLTWDEHSRAQVPVRVCRR